MKFMKLGSKPDSFQTDGDDVRFVATELATDVIVYVGNTKFYLHKFPLLSKSARLQKLVTITGEDGHDEIHIPDIPGGPTGFEVCAKFCYGMTVTLNAYNVVSARCAAEFLEMNETLEKGNLIYKIDVFLNSSVFRSWKDSIIVLQTTKSLIPWSEDLKVINHCVDSIASKASIDGSRVDWSYTYNRTKLPAENGTADWNGVKKQQVVPNDWWVEDLCELDLDFYKRVLVSIKSMGKLSGRVVGEALKAYTYRRLSGFGKGTINPSGDIVKNQILVETIVSLLPIESGSVSCGFLLKLLRASNTLDCDDIIKRDLVKRIGLQLYEASVSDILIPNRPEEVTVYDVDLVQNIVEEFVIQEHHKNIPNTETNTNTNASMLSVAKLVDGYLAEIARDPNLLLSKFINLADLVSSSSRPAHDGLYRAVDMYLKEHPSLSKSEKKRICNLMDCRKLSADACTHAIQNERLPLRVVVQVLFFEQTRVAAGSVRAIELPTSTSHGSSRSAATANTEDVLGSERSSGGSSGDAVMVAAHNKKSDSKVAAGQQNNKVKGAPILPKKMLSKLWSNKSQRSGGGENSSSDTSGSPISANIEESKSTPLRSVRHSVS